MRHAAFPPDRSLVPGAEPHRGLEHVASRMIVIADLVPLRPEAREGVRCDFLCRWSIQHDQVAGTRDPREVVAIEPLEPGAVRHDSVLARTRLNRLHCPRSWELFAARYRGSSWQELSKGAVFGHAPISSKTLYSGYHKARKEQRPDEVLTDRTSEDRASPDGQESDGTTCPPRPDLFNEQPSGDDQGHDGDPKQHVRDVLRSGSRLRPAVQRREATSQAGERKCGRQELGQPAELRLHPRCIGFSEPLLEDSHRGYETGSNPRKPVGVR